MKTITLTLTNLLNSIELNIAKAKTLLNAKTAKTQVAAAENGAAEPAAE